jgi:hypothetical protein
MPTRKSSVKSRGRSSRKSPRCSKGQIVRKGYRRRSSRSSRSTYVSPSCITDRGKKGHGTQLFKLEKDVLKKYGYHDIKSLTVSERRQALRSALKDGVPALSLFRRLNALHVLTKNTSPAISSKFKADRDFVKTTTEYKNRKSSPRKSSPRKSSYRRSSSRTRRSK